MGFTSDSSASGASSVRDRPRRDVGPGASGLSPARPGWGAVSPSGQRPQQRRSGGASDGWIPLRYSGPVVPCPPAAGGGCCAWGAPSCPAGLLAAWLREPTEAGRAHRRSLRNRRQSGNNKDNNQNNNRNQNNTRTARVRRTARPARRTASAVGAPASRPRVARRRRMTASAAAWQKGRIAPRRANAARPRRRRALTPATPSARWVGRRAAAMRSEPRAPTALAAACATQRTIIGASSVRQAASAAGPAHPVPAGSPASPGAATSPHSRATERPT